MLVRYEHLLSEAQLTIAGTATVHCIGHAPCFVWIRAFLWRKNTAAKPRPEHTHINLENTGVAARLGEARAYHAYTMLSVNMAQIASLLPFHFRILGRFERKKVESEEEEGWRGGGVEGWRGRGSGIGRKGRRGEGLGARG